MDAITAARTTKLVFLISLLIKNFPSMIGFLYFFVINSKTEHYQFQGCDGETTVETKLRIAKYT